MNAWLYITFVIVLIALLLCVVGIAMYICSQPLPEDEEDDE